MIFNLVPANQTHGTILVFDDSTKAWDAWEMLDATKNGLVCAHICCYGNYENALEFYADWLPQ